MSSLLGKLSVDEFESNITNSFHNEAFDVQERSKHPICSELCRKCYGESAIKFEEKLLNVIIHHLKKHCTRICQVSGTPLTEYMYVHLPTKLIMSKAFYHLLKPADREVTIQILLFNSSYGRSIIRHRLNEIIRPGLSFQMMCQLVKAFNPHFLEYLLFKDV